jgi:RNA polymerase sigma-32 factor
MRLRAVSDNPLSTADQQALVSDNRKLVYKIAGELHFLGAPFNDLVQEGCVGLCRAASKYDQTRGVKFSTYAAYWIRACMMAFALNTRGPVRFGSTKNQRKIFYHYSRIKRRLEEAGESATPEKIANELGVSLEQVVDAIPRVENRDPSLDVRYDDDGQNLRMVVADANPRADELLERASTDEALRVTLRRTVALLKPKHAGIIRDRFLRKTPLTLQEIGDRLGLSRERVRQIELQALTTLRRLLAGRGMKVGSSLGA